jgi:peptide/nickel transport system substrate-binding protein
MPRESTYRPNQLRIPIVRRRLLRTAALGGAGAAGWLLAACGGDDDTEQDRAAAGTGAPATAAAAATALPEGKPGGALSLGFAGSLGGVDPHNSITGGTFVGPAVYNYLLRTGILAPDRGIVYDLAQSHELAGDQVTWIFKLRPDVTIAKNKYSVPERPLDAEDVKQSFQRISDPAAAANNSAWARDIVERFDAPDSTTFRIITKRPYGWLLHDIGNPWASMVPREWLAHPDLKKDTVGGGPFVLTELTEGKQARLARNPAYYVKDRPYLDEYFVKVFADATTVRTAFASGQLDAYGAPNKDEAEELKKQIKDLQHFKGPTLTYLSFWMNTKEKPWDDPRVRRAVHRATNRQEYIALIGKGEGDPIALISTGMNPYALSTEEVAKLAPYNVAEARQLFQAAGVTEFKYTYSATGGAINDYVSVFTRQMQAAGVKAVAEPLDQAAWLAAFFENKLSATMTGTQEYPHPSFTLAWHESKGISGNGRYLTGFSDAEVDAGLAKAAGTIDNQARVEAYREVQRLLLNKDPALFHFFATKANTLIAPKVQNYPVGTGSLGSGGFGSAFLRDIWIKT